VILLIQVSRKIFFWQITIENTKINEKSSTLWYIWTFLTSYFSRSICAIKMTNMAHFGLIVCICNKKFPGTYEEMYYIFLTWMKTKSIKPFCIEHQTLEDISFGRTSLLHSYLFLLISLSILETSFWILVASFSVALCSIYIIEMMDIILLRAYNRIWWPEFLFTIS
jgi:hypothetical protein